MTAGRSCSSHAFSNKPGRVTPGRYDMRTVHAEAFGGTALYTRTAEDTLAELSDFVRAEQGKS